MDKVRREIYLRYAKNINFLNYVELAGWFFAKQEKTNVREGKIVQSLLDELKEEDRNMNPFLEVFREILKLEGYC